MIPSSSPQNPGRFNLRRGRPEASNAVDLETARALDDAVHGIQKARAQVVPVRAREGLASY